MYKRQVFDRARLQPGETLLVHGGPSGIGTTAIQLAKALGSRVFVTVGGAEKMQPCLDLGAERAIDYREEDFVQAVKEPVSYTHLDVYKRQALTISRKAICSDCSSATAS